MATRQFEYTRAHPNPWLITTAQLSSTPSLSDGLSRSQETLLRAETADFVSQMGQQCKITQWAIATGSVYLHVFFTRFSFARFDRFEVAATCLFLAGKVEERRTRVDQVINAYYHVRLNAVQSSSSSSQSSQGAAIHLLPPSQTSPEYDALRNRIYTLEFALLDAIEFVFEVSHPYPNLMTYLRETIYGPSYANKRTPHTPHPPYQSAPPPLAIRSPATLADLCLCALRVGRREAASFITKETSEKGGLAQIAWLFINDRCACRARLSRSVVFADAPPDLSLTSVCALWCPVASVPPSL